MAVVEIVLHTGQTSQLPQPLILLSFFQHLREAA
jgi:hypothetical protein